VLAASESGGDVAAALYDLWRDPARAAELGRMGATGVRAHYTTDHMAHAVLSAYQAALNKRPGE
jgi:hypothetical protein